MSTRPIKRLLSLLLLLATATGASASNEPVIANQSASGTVCLPFFYQVVASAPNQFPITSYGTTVSVPGIVFNTANGQFSGTPTAAGTYNGNISATNSKGTSTAAMTITIAAYSFVGFRLPDFLTTASTPNNPKLMLEMGANGATTAANRFNATLEVNAGTVATPILVPYNHFAGIADTNPNYTFRDSWINDAALPIRQSSS